MNLYSAIIVCENNGVKSFAKYRNINNCNRFLSFVQKKWQPMGAIAVNFYHKKTKLFSHQVKL